MTICKVDYTRKTLLVMQDENNNKHYLVQAGEMFDTFTIEADESKCNEFTYYALDAALADMMDKYCVFSGVDVKQRLGVAASFLHFTASNV